jgi:hypothetical protein
MKRQYIQPAMKYLSMAADGELLITSINGGDTGISYGGEGNEGNGGGNAYSNEYTFFYVWDQEAEEEEEDEDF